MINIFFVSDYTLVNPKKYFAKNLELWDQRNIFLVLGSKL